MEIRLESGNSLLLENGNALLTELSAVSRSFAAAYSVLAQIERVFSAAYSVMAGVQRTFSAAYSVLAGSAAPPAVVSAGAGGVVVVPALGDPILLDRFSKQPDEVLDYDVDFSDWFARRLDMPQSVNVIVEPGMTMLSQSIQGRVVRIVLSGGTSGARYKVTVRLTTTAGIVKEADFRVAVREI